MTIEYRQLKASSLQLKRYFVTQLNIIANPSFDASKETAQKEPDICLSGELLKNAEDPTLFQIKHNLKIQSSAESNIPYSVVVEIIGVFKSAFTGSDEQVERVVFVNGGSILYSTAREIVRASTAFGPYGQILIPSVVFAEPATPTPSPAQ
jgi:preprotein translocase subunit SecB